MGPAISWGKKEIYSSSRGRLRSVPINVDDVGQGLKGEKGNADGKADAGDGPVHAQQPVDRLHQKAAVLEHHQQPDVPHHRHGSQRLAALLPSRHRQGQRPVDHDGEEQQQHIQRLPPSIENQAGDNQQGVAEFPVGDDGVQQKGDGEKEKQKTQRTKNHISTKSFRLFRNPAARGGKIKNLCGKAVADSLLRLQIIEVPPFRRQGRQARLGTISF